MQEVYRETEGSNEESDQAFGEQQTRDVAETSRQIRPRKEIPSQIREGSEGNRRPRLTTFENEGKVFFVYV